MQLSKTQEQSTRLLERELRPIVSRLAELELTPLLKGDYEVKIARQQFYLRRQADVLLQVRAY